MSGEHLGLRITSPYIYGISIEHFEPQKPDHKALAADCTVEICDGLQRYVRNRVEAGESLFSDIYTENQLMFGATEPGASPEVILIDVDPYFMKSSKANEKTALNSIKYTQSYALHQIRKRT